MIKDGKFSGTDPARTAGAVIEKDGDGEDDEQDHIGGEYPHFRRRRQSRGQDEDGK